MRFHFMLPVLLWLGTGGAMAADCSLKLFNTVPVTLAMNGTRILAPVGINGTEKMFLLDTGGAMTQISAAAANELKLPVAESYVRMLDMYGNASESAVRVESFALGRLKDKNTILPVMTGLFDDDAPFVGILAADYMGRYDVELDLNAGKMNYFSPDHCPGKVVYWPAQAIAVVPMKFIDHHLILTVMLDGKPVRAMIDTGAPQTTIFADAAKRLFGVTGDSPGAEVLSGTGDQRNFHYIFQKLAFEGLEVSNPHLSVEPDRIGRKDPNNSFVTGSRIHHIDDRDSTEPVMLIGMNILTKLHLYIAFQEQNIYVTPAAAPAPRP